MKEISTIQQSILLTQNIYNDSSLYNVGGYALIQGRIQVTLLCECIQHILKSADVMDMGYRLLNYSKNADYILKECHIDQVDFSKEHDPDAACMEYLNKDIQVKFTLDECLVKIAILKATSQRYYWYTKVHHIVFDGYSMSLFFNKVACAYNEYALGNDINHTTRPYRDFIREEQDYKNAEEYHRDRKFWLERISEGLQSKTFKSCFISEGSGTTSSDRLELTITRELYNRIDLFCKQRHCTVYHYFISVIFLLNKLYNNGQTIIGLPVFNRHNHRFKNTIGPFVNVLPFSVALGNEITFEELMLNVCRELKSCYRHQRFPLYELLKEINQSGNIYNLIFSYQKNTFAPVLGDASVTIRYLHSREQQEDMIIHLLEYSQTEDLQLLFDFKTELFSENVIKMMGTHFSNLLTCVLNNYNMQIGNLPYLNEEETHKILYAFNSSQENFEDKTVVSLLESQVMKKPDHIALLFDGNRLTYDQLNQRSNRLSHYLREKFQVGTGDCIGVMLERSVDNVIAMIAIMKTGACYVPIDHQYPKNRIVYILSDVRVKVVLTHSSFRDAIAIEKGSCIFLDQINLLGYEHGNPTSVNELDDNSYVIYTSGSTGNPKGVVQTHRMLSNLVQWGMYKSDMTKGLRQLQYASFGFDASLHDIYFTLCGGGTLYVLNEEQRLNHNELLQVILSEKIQVLSFPFAALKHFFSHVNLSDLSNHAIRYIISTGEQLYVNGNLLEFLKRNPSVELHNHYGPSETHVVTSHTMSAALGNLTFHAPIGAPISNTDVYVLDDNKRLLPIGVLGELYIGGANLAKGYLNLESESEACFVNHPFSSHERLYKTGDMCRWLPEGNIEFIGRVDDQVKIRGFRVELRAIEKEVLAYSGISDAIAFLNKENDLYLYFISQEKIDQENVRDFLRASLPAYMIPAYFIQLKTFPLTSNGKIDKMKLLEFTPSATLAEKILPPGNETEKHLLEIWKEVLLRNDIGVTQNFFDLGGHSLKAMHLVSLIQKKFGKDIRISDVFQRSTIRKQSVMLDLERHQEFVPISKSKQESCYPLSPSQERLWIVCQLDEASMAYNMPGVFTLEGNLDVSVLGFAFNNLIARHESLRTVFKRSAGGEIKQYILDREDLKFNIPIKDIRSLQGQQQIDEWIKRETERSFDLSSGPLLYVSLLHIDENKWILIVVVHHLISDGWSIKILLRELLQNYENSLFDQEHVDTPLSIQYKDYVAWLTLSASPEKRQKDKAYWLDMFQGDLPILDMPLDFHRPAIKTYSGGIVVDSLGCELGAKLLTLCQEQGGTLFMGLLSVVNIFLFKYTQQKDQIIGSPVLGRDHPDLKNQVGLYTNTTALRCRFQEQDNFLSLFERIKEFMFATLEHSTYSYDQLINDLDLPFDRSRNPLFDVMLIFQDEETKLLEECFRMGDVYVKEYDVAGHAHSKFDLTFTFAEHQNNVHIEIEYNSSLFKRDTVVQFSKHLKQLIEAIVEEPNKSINQLSFIDESEKHQLLFAFNDTNKVCPEDKSVVQIFSRRVQEMPNAPAVVFEDISLTYEQLDRLSNQLANYLRCKYNVQSGSFVGIQLDRSEWLIIAMLAIIKCGCAYVPLDPDCPEGRLQYLCNDSGISFLINAQTILDFRKVKGRIPNTDLLVELSPERVIYVIYTSGTTGNPKGVLVTHSNVVAFIANMDTRLGLSDVTKIAATTNVTFDISVLEIIGGLCTGKAVYLISTPCLSDSTAFMLWLEAQQIEALQVTPSRLSLLYGTGINFPSSLKLLLVGGENLSQTIYEQLVKESFESINVYGPTETTIWSSGLSLKQSNRLSIGTPLQNERIYILDPERNLQPIGVYGELYIAGNGVTKGYLNAPELTESKFQENLFEGVGCMYRTGDIGRWLADGNIEFLGRKDNQVKVSGYRIELDEIEVMLQRQSGVSQAVVVVILNQNEEQEIVAYLVGKEISGISDLRSDLSKVLPSYMIPHHFVFLDALPLTSSGKVDRKRLPDPTKNVFRRENVCMPPQNKTEEALIEIWKEVLGKEQIGVTDDFFELGGHSLKAAKLINHIYRTFGIQIKLGALFENTTVQHQSKLIREGSNQASIYSNIPSIEVKDSYLLSHTQQRIWTSIHMTNAILDYNDSHVLLIKGILNLTYLDMAVRKLLVKHESLRTIFKEDSQGEVKQYILSPDEIPFRINQIDLSDKPQKEEFAHRYMQQDAVTPFVLSQFPLFRLLLIKMEEGKYYFHITMHHLIGDGWSSNLLVRDFFDQYERFSSQKNEGKPIATSVRYVDYVYWLEKEINDYNPYWKDIFKDPVSKLDFPYDTSSSLGNQGGSIFAMVDGALEFSLREMAIENRTTLSNVLFAAYAILVGAFSSQKTFFIGQMVAGRDHPQLEEIIGAFMNYLPIRIDLDAELSFKAYIALLTRSMTEALENQHIPFDELVNKYAQLPEDGNSPSPIFDTLFNFHSASDELNRLRTGSLTLPISGLEITSIPQEQRTAPIDFKMDVAEIGSGIDIHFNYRQKLFSKSYAQFFVDKYIQLLKTLLDNNNLKLGDISVFSEEEESEVASKKNNTPSGSLIKICTSFVADPVKPHLVYWLNETEMDMKVDCGPYNQVFQQLIDSHSWFWKGNGAKIVLIRFRDWIRHYDGKSLKEQKLHLERSFEELKQVLREKQDEEADLLTGVLGWDEEHPLQGYLNDLNSRYQLFTTETNWLWIDFQNLASAYKLTHVFDPHADEMGHIPFTDEYFSLIGMQLARSMYALRKSNYKVIVFDCDNTLWKGICGEDGISGIEINDNYLFLQKFLKHKYDQGFLLAISSKNNEQDVWNVFENHPNMILTRDMIISYRINWGNKSESINEIAAELNLQQVSFIFLDDSPFECEEVERHCPDVLTIQIPNQAEHIGSFLDRIWAFDKLKVTKEDKIRNSTYRANKSRERLRIGYQNADDFIKSLNIEVHISDMEATDINRVFQLCQRTNQFNLNGMIYTQDDLYALMKSESRRCKVINVHDRFGEYGLVGAVVLNRADEKVIVESFLLSCRVLGRNVEFQIFEHIISHAKEWGSKTIELNYNNTTKNVPFRSFLDATPLLSKGISDAFEVYSLNLN